MHRQRGLSALELVIALVILGVVAAIAIPRFGQAANHPASDADLVRDQLRVLRIAIERYYHDHRAYPGQHTDGQHAAGTAAAFVAQLTGPTDETGHVGSARDARHRFGPYLRDGLPGSAAANPAAATRVHIVRGSTRPTWTPEAAEAGWVYNCDTGQIGCHSGRCDEVGRAFADF